MVKIPATPEGVPAVQELIAEGRNINVTLLFGLERYEQIIDAYLAGLEACTGDLSRIHSVASFFLSRVDTRSTGTWTESVPRMRSNFAGEPLCTGERGVPPFPTAVLRPAMGSARSSRRTCAASAMGVDVDQESGLPGHDVCRRAHCTRHRHYIDRGHDRGVRRPRHRRKQHRESTDASSRILEQLVGVGINMREVTNKLENEGVAAFTHSFDQLLATLQPKRRGRDSGMSVRPDTTSAALVDSAQLDRGELSLS